MSTLYDASDRPRHAAGASTGASTGTSAFDAILQDVIREPLKKTTEHVDLALDRHHAAVRDLAGQVEELQATVDRLARRVESADRAATERDPWLVARLDAMYSEQRTHTADRMRTAQARQDMSGQARRLTVVLTALFVLQLVTAGITLAIVEAL